MNIIRNTIAIVAITGLGLFAFTGNAKANSYQHVDLLASQLQKQVRVLHGEVHAHFRFTPQFRHLDDDVNEMERLARHIHDVAHRHGSIAHLRADVQKLDRLYHHVEDIVRRMNYTGQFDFRARRHINSTLFGIGRTLHHLSDDLDQMSRYHGHGHDGHYGHGYSPTIRLPRLGLSIRLRH